MHADAPSYIGLDWARMSIYLAPWQYTELDLDVNSYSLWALTKAQIWKCPALQVT